LQMSVAVREKDGETLPGRIRAIYPEFL